MHPINPKEFEAIIKLPANIRYEYFIKKVADSEEVWGLYDDGWAMSSDENGSLLIPFWPKKEFADYCAYEDWSNYKAQGISLNEFINDWLPNMSEDQRKPSIFWNRDDSAVLEIQVLLNDLEQELEKY
ncbi:DUF2750 domain-containing protein [Paenibacillus roseipurpureus]|uniref:DUF2750 domain-containing protein n=1 Tax=Paenibacillus roseopurpureus TaxID=2918901 RepID=A0AA96LYI4_9BACL|nr:DUF2750 domain-containing protein [Paenibacillus sp. MBLB1832]WNR46870.1 DUF2750 domain-containing protein [Paenibacillus sp. MBLB1832]